MTEFQVALDDAGDPARAVAQAIADVEAVAPDKIGRDELVGVFIETQGDDLGIGRADERERRLMDIPIEPFVLEERTDCPLGKTIESVELDGRKELHVLDVP